MHPSSTPLTGKVVSSASTLPSLDERSSWKIAGDAIPKLKPELPDSWEALKLTVENGWGDAPSRPRAALSARVNRGRGSAGPRGVMRVVALMISSPAKFIFLA